ncbi:hypothetical protein KUV26_03770 [Leisingera daeponensis]|uniref:Uncharacterized protein n=1 Tax=Leisingera daeponensis TaxID=405746 RepID=A0ABS7NBH0_9RHOB|nr:hypothetical protein [Leisingera daeponensis]MBY6138544.1 hypothetical protein [Leisingera daeponensis]
MLDFSPSENWRRLRQQHRRPARGRAALFHEGVLLGDVVDDAAGRLACLATPYATHSGGPVIAADMALNWLGLLAKVRIPAVAPAFMAAEAELLTPEPELVMARVELVIIPPLDGWQECPGVWRAAFLALELSKPVYLLNGGADG